MALIEAVLTYRPHGLGGETPVPLGTTADPRALRALRDALVEQAREEARRWRDIDPGIFAVKAAEFERLCKVLAWLLPEEALRPELHVVKGKPHPSSSPPDAPSTE